MGETAGSSIYTKSIERTGELFAAFAAVFSRGVASLLPHKKFMTPNQ